jgi:hypothetical protein
MSYLRPRLILCNIRAIGVALWSAFVVATPTLAANIENPLIAENLQDFFMAIIAIVIVFATPIIVFFIIYAGFLYVTARGNEQTITQANRALLYAVIGGLLILGAYGIITIVSNLITAMTA